MVLEVEAEEGVEEALEIVVVAEDEAAGEEVVVEVLAIEAEVEVDLAVAVVEGVLVIEVAVEEDLAEVVVAVDLQVVAAEAEAFVADIKTRHYRVSSEQLRLILKMSWIAAFYSLIKQIKRYKNIAKPLHSNFFC